jgi:hypothetical protein
MYHDDRAYHGIGPSNFTSDFVRGRPISRIVNQVVSTSGTSTTVYGVDQRYPNTKAIILLLSVLPVPPAVL